MNWNKWVFQTAMLMDKLNPDPAPNPPPAPNPTPDAKDIEIANLKKSIEEMKAKNNPNPDPAPNPDDLAEKARKERESIEAKAKEHGQVESALKFTMGSKDFVKENESYLPDSIKGIFEAAEKENYGSSIKKANAIKVGIITEFFNLQANLDLLTPGLKSALEDFKKLTKDGREEQAQRVYDMVFEPALDSMKRQKKAEQISKGHGTTTDVEQAYKERLMKGSRKHHLGEK